MKQRIRAAAKALLGRNAFPELNTDKKELIDFACERLGMNSFADLGAIWNVDGGYTFYAMERHRIKNAFAVDTDFTPPFLERQKKHPGLKIIQGNFGDRSVLERICEVDGVFFFDTLLHQVRPDWDEILQMYE